MGKTAVILFNLGGPTAEEEISPFLFRFFNDPAILPFPGPLRYVCAKLFSRLRLSKSKAIYRKIGGGSPLVSNTFSQAKDLQEKLGEPYKVFVSMRHTPPFIEEVVEAVKKENPEKIILLPLFPQYSTTTTGSFFKAWKQKTKNLKIPTSAVCSYPTNEGFLQALREESLPLYKEAQKYGSPLVLLTAHGLPEKTIKKGDPYQKQVLETAKEFKKITGFQDTIVCYQSRVGWLPWIRPFLEDVILQGAREKRPLLVIPLSFVSEHSETLVELDILMRDLALEEGSPYYGRVKTVQTHPLFIGGLSSLVKDLKNDTF